MAMPQYCYLAKGAKRNDAHSTPGVNNKQPYGPTVDNKERQTVSKFLRSDHRVVEVRQIP